MAQPAQFLYEKAWRNLFSKTDSFFVFHTKKPQVNMLMKLTPGSASPTILFLHISVLLFYDLMATPGNTKGGSITVQLTSCLTVLESAV
jgi:hypothetical protein